MIDATTGAEVWWDADVGTLCGVFNGMRVGVKSRDCDTVAELEAALGVELGVDTKLALLDACNAQPFHHYVSKNRFMDLFGAHLAKVYERAESDAWVRIGIDRVRMAPKDVVELTDGLRMIGLLQHLETLGDIPAGGAMKIYKGIAL